MKKCMNRDYISEGQAYGVRKGTCLPEMTRWPHSHEFIEIVYVSSGKGVHYIGDRVYEAGRGSLLFIDCDVAHSFSTAETMTYVNFYIDPSEIDPRLRGIGSIWELLAFLFPEGQVPSEMQTAHVELDAAFLPEMQLCAESVHRELRTKRCGYELAVDGYMRLIYAGILRAMLPTSVKRRKIIPADILDYVEQNYTGRITLADLAGRFYYNPVYLGKLFKSTFGVPFKRYVLEKRLEKAETLLLETGMTVEAVAAAVGFSDKKFFYRCFEDTYDCTPLQYRQRHEINQGGLL